MFLNEVQDMFSQGGYIGFRRSNWSDPNFFIYPGTGRYCHELFSSRSGVPQNLSVEDFKANDWTMVLSINEDRNNFGANIVGNSLNIAIIPRRRR